MVRHVAHIEISGAGDVVDAPWCDVVPVETEDIDRGFEGEVVAHPLGVMKQGLGSLGQEPLLHCCYPGVFHAGSPSRLWRVHVLALAVECDGYPNCRQDARQSY